MQRLRLLLIGPLSGGLVGGTWVSFVQLVRELREDGEVELDVLDTARGKRRGRLADLRAALRVLTRVPAHLRSVDVVTLHASARAVVLCTPILALMCRLARRPLAIRVFGGNFDREFAALPAPVRRLLVVSLRGTWLLLQTRALVAHFEALLPATHCRWYSNSRPWTPSAGGERSAGGARSFVYVGHVRPAKGIPELLDAARALDPHALRVDVYGPFLQGGRLEDFDGHPVVRYCGELPPEQVAGTLRRYDAFLLPTYHFDEGYPGAILEAYAEGLPVITTRFRALPEIVEDGVSGLLIEPRDHAALAAAMLRLHRDTELMQRLRRGALERAEFFASRRWTRVFVELCREARDARVSALSGARA